MEETGLKVRRSNMMYRTKEHPCMLADLDRLVAGKDAGLECKTANAYNADKWRFIHFFNLKRACISLKPAAALKRRLSCWKL